MGMVFRCLEVSQMLFAEFPVVRRHTLAVVRSVLVFI